MEKFEIVFLLLFIAYWVFYFLTKNLTQKQNPVEKKGVTLRVLEFIASFKETSENEQNNIGLQINNHPQVAPQPAPVIIKKEEYVAPTAARLKTREQQQKSTATPPLKQPHKKLTDQLQLPVIAQITKGAGRKFPKQKLRNAIIWSEILGTPVGLRDNE